MRALIDQSLQCLTRLCEQLREETERLRTRNIEGLDELLSAKAELLQQLEQLEQQRRGLVAAAGFGTDAEGMWAYLDAQGDAALRNDWQAMAELLGVVRQMNETNGLVIQRSLEQVERGLRVLHGQSGAGEGYDPSGKRSSGTRGREISRA